MPLFLFTSGLFARSVFKNGVVNSSNVVYYILLSVSLSFFLSVEKFLLGGSFLFNPFSLGGIPWYLMVLAFYLCAVPLFVSLKPVFAIGFSVVVAVLSGYFEIGDTLALSRALVFLPFFLSGLYLGEQRVVDFLQSLEGSGCLAIARLVALLLVGTIMLLFFCLDAGELSALRSLFSGRAPLLPIVERIGVEDTSFAPIVLRGLYYIAVGIVSAAAMILVPRRTLPCLTTMGKNSLQVYYFHAFIYYAFNALSISASLYVVLPSWAATALLYLLGLLIAVALGVAPFLGTVMAQVRRGIGQFVRRVPDL